MTDHDEAARELVRRAYAADPVEDEYDVRAGLRRVQARTDPLFAADAIGMVAGVPAELQAGGVAVRKRVETAASRIEIGTLTVMSTHGGCRVGPHEGRIILFGRSEPNVHVAFGVDDLMVSRLQGEVVCRNGRWWIRNRGRSPIQLAARPVYSGDEWGPLPDGSTSMYVAGHGGRQHMLGFHVDGQGGRRLVDPDYVTAPPRTWRLEFVERLALVVIGQQYLRLEQFPWPLSRRQAAVTLASLDPDGRWTDRRVEHVLARVRARLSASGIAGLTLDEVGEPAGDRLTHNLVVELVRSTTLIPADLELLERASWE